MTPICEYQKEERNVVKTKNLYASFTFCLKLVTKALHLKSVVFLRTNLIAAAEAAVALPEKEPTPTAY